MASVPQNIKHVVEEEFDRKVSSPFVTISSKDDDSDYDKWEGNEGENDDDKNHDKNDDSESDFSPEYKVKAEETATIIDYWGNRNMSVDRLRLHSKSRAVVDANNAHATIPIIIEIRDASNIKQYFVYLMWLL